MRRLGQVIGVVAVLLVSAGLIHASGTASGKCASSKSKAASKKLAAKLKCYQKALSKGVGVDGACLTSAETKFNSAMSKADGKGGCAFPNDANTLERVVDNAVNAINAFEPNSPLRCCTGGVGFACYYGDASCPAGGTVGAQGTVCDAATGACIAPSASPGHCCTIDPNFAGPECVSGPIYDGVSCTVGLLGSFDLTGLCPPDGGGCVHIGNLP
jgi:hypothetical protein